MILLDVNKYANSVIQHQIKLTEFLIHSLFGTKSKDVFVEIEEKSAFLTAKNVHFFTLRQNKRKFQKLEG